MTNPTPDYAAAQFDRWLAQHEDEVVESVLARVREKLGAEVVLRAFSPGMDYKFTSDEVLAISEEFTAEWFKETM